MKNLSQKQKQNIIVIVCGIVIALAIVYFVIFSDDNKSIKDSTTVMVGGVGGEAQSLNFGVPNANKKLEDLQRSKEYEQSYIDSINKLKEFEKAQNSINYGYGSTNQNINTSKPNLEFSDDLNTHSVSKDYNPYGNTDMWQVNEPTNSKIGYSNINSSKKSKKRKSVETEMYEDEDYEISSSKSTNTDSKPKSKWIRTKYGIVNSDYFASNNNSTRQNINSTQNKLKTEKLYKANIYVPKPIYLTPENNRVKIRVIEPFSVGGIELKQGQILTAYASFGNTMRLKINNVLIDGERIPLSISVLDMQGQEDIQIIGQTGDDIKNDVRDEAFSYTTTPNGIINKAVDLIKGKKKTKVLVSNDYVYLRVD